MTHAVAHEACDTSAGAFVRLRTQCSFIKARHFYINMFKVVLVAQVCSITATVKEDCLTVKRRM